MPSIMNTIGWIADSFGPAVRKSGRFASSMINDVKQRGVAEALKDAPQTKKAIFDTTQLKSARNSIDNLMVDFDAGELTKSADKYDRALQFASDSGFDTGEGLRDMSDALTKEIAEREAGKVLTYGGAAGATYLGADAAGRAFTNVQGERDVPLLPFV